MAELRRIEHPGPVAAERITFVRCRAAEVCARLRPGLSFLEALHEAAGGGAAWFVLKDLPVRRLTFVRPAPAPGGGRAAWYSAPTTLENARIVRAGAHLGEKDGKPFAHVHGIWQDGGGDLHMGHLLAPDTLLACEAVAEMWELKGARLEVSDDAETQFSLFRPVQTGSVERPNALLATIRPNVALHKGIHEIARLHGIGEARVMGLGSLIGTSFENCPPVDSYATEVLLDKCRIDGSGAELAGASTGFSTGFQEGFLSRDNVVCVTFELLLTSAGWLSHPR